MRVVGAPSSFLSALLPFVGLALALATAACTADARPTAEDFELRGSSGTTRTGAPADADNPPEAADRARLEAGHPSVALELADEAEAVHEAH